MKKKGNSWKEALDNNVLAPLFIGFAIGGVGYIFEYDPLAWIGTGLMGYGFFRMLYDG